MRSRNPLIVSVALAVVFGPICGREAIASDPPHWISKTFDINCTSQCHTLHTSQGAALTASASNANLCMSCHNKTGLASDLPINSVDAAVPGVSGTSHAWEVGATGKYDTTLPSDNEMAVRIMGGEVVCSTCHNQHLSPSNLGGTPKISVAKQITALGSTGTVTSGGAYTGTEGSWFLIRISSSGNFQYSRDNGTSFFPEQSLGPDVALGADGVTATFTGAAGDFTIGEEWQFYAAYPFLRRALHDTGPNVDSALCLECHGAWDMDWTATGGTRDYTGANRSHPVGVTLSANGGGYDRGAPLDADGSANDGNPTNDLVLGSNGVHCLTCHGMHYIDSNGNSVDGP